MGEVVSGGFLSQSGDLAEHFKRVKVNAFWPLGDRVPLAILPPPEQAPAQCLAALQILS